MIEGQQSSNRASPAHVPPEIRGAPSIAAPVASAGDIVRADELQLGEAHRAFAEFHGNYVSSYIALADTKAAWIFAITSGLLVYMFNGQGVAKILVLPGMNVAFILAASTVLLLILSAAFSVFVISPRFKSSGDGVVFYSAVARKGSADVFIRNIASMNSSSLTEARLKHCYDISYVCAQKYIYLRLAFWAGVLALIGIGGLLLIK